MPTPTSTNRKIYTILSWCIAAVWIVNGLFCKVLNLVPRHQQIVARILGNQHPDFFTALIGLFEIAMAIWVASGIKTRLNAITQIVIVATMNILEFILVPDLLLWGKLNLVFAVFFIGLVYYNEFYLNKKPAPTA